MDFSNNEINQQLANYLREQRIEQGLDLDDLSNKIGIPIHHLKNIEGGHFESFDPFYLRMYLKKYATTLSLNMDDLNQRFYGVDVQQEQTRINKVKRQKKEKRQTNFGKILGVLVAAVIIVMGLYFAVDIVRSMIEERGERKDLEISHQQEPEDETEEEGVPEEAEEEEEDEEEELPVEVDPITTIEKVSHESGVQTFAVETEWEEVEVFVQFTADCWVTGQLNNENFIPPAGKIYGDGDTFEQIFTAEELANGEGAFNFVFGNVQAIGEFLINGEPVQLETVGLSRQEIKINLILN